MKYTFVQGDIGAVKKWVTPVVFSQKTETARFVEKGGHTELYIGIPKREEITRRKFILLCRKVIQGAKQHKIKKIAVQFEKTPFPKLKQISGEEIASLMAENFEMANFEFQRFKTKPKEGWSAVTEIFVYGSAPTSIKNAFKKGQAVGRAVNECRVLANTPGGDMTPTLLARAAANALSRTKARTKVLGVKELKKLRMGAVLGVAKGSNEEPKFIIMEYWGAGKPSSARRKSSVQNPIVLAGKGVTFDTGGLNLKGESGILGMHLDMSGGAAVIHTIALAARLKLKKNVVGLIPAVENMPSGSSYRPGDVLRSMSGKTIDIINTDAEGRVILADALTYAKRYKPRLVVDVATLTGAALVALGTHASAIMTRDEKLSQLFSKLGEESGEYVWPLPLWDEYEEYVKGVFGDVANVPVVGNSRNGGVINGGMFLYQFVKDKNGTPSYPWVHIDMAPRMEAIPQDCLAKGAAGSPVRLLFKLLLSY